MSEGVIIAFISASIPTIATIIAGYIQSRTAMRNSAKSDILQMIMEDKMAFYHEDGLPTNYQSILMAYDRYHKAGGDSYITDKVEEYKEWHLAIQKGKAK